MIIRNFKALILTLLFAGCSVEKPSDASNPEASAKWIFHCMKNVDKAKTDEEKIDWLREAYDHAQSLGKTTAAQNAIPKTVRKLALRSKDLDAFKWSLQTERTPELNYQNLMEIWNMGQEWRDVALRASPHALPYYMSAAIDNYEVDFFNQHAEAFKATNYKVRSPLESSEFNIRYRRFIGNELQEALQIKNEERIRFLTGQMPRVTDPNHLDKKTDAIMRALGEYLINDLQDESLATQMVELRYALNPIDLSTLSFDEPFFDALRADPKYAIQTQKLNIWTASLTEADVDFLLTLPDDAWTALHPAHLDEAIEICIRKKNSNAAVRLIASKNNQNPLNQSDYNNLLEQALRHGEEAVFNYVMQHSDEIDIYSIRFDWLAQDQTLFVKHAPQIMKRIHYTLSLIHI